MTNALTWFEIPATDFDRACSFYGSVLGAEIARSDFNGIPNGILPYQSPGVGGALVQYPEGLEPSIGGTRIYLSVTGPIDDAAARIEQAGGTVLLPKTWIGDPGYIVLFIDSEGNQVGLNARQ